MKLGSALLGAWMFFGTNVASAALTSSEKGQIKDFVAGAHAQNTHKVRALVARTDLTADESIAALTDAVLPVVFTEPRGSFLKELAFGGASAASRSTIVLAAVKALVARADTIYQRYGGGLENESSAIQELVAIYGWLDATIANAGKPTRTAHDGGAGIPAATYDDCSKVLRDHIERQARWLKGGGTVPDTIGRLRAQAQVTLIDMMPDGLTRWVDAADRLALSGARRAMLLNWGVLFADAGKLDEPRLERVRQILARLPGARVDLGLIYAGDDRGGPLRARGLVAYVAPGASPYPFSDEVAPGTYDPMTSAIAHDLAVIAAERALDSSGELRLQAERDAAAASGDMGRLLGRPRAPSVEHVMGAAIHALLMDAPRAVDLSFARLLGSRPETAALLSDAIGALAVSAIEDKDAKGKGTKLALGGKGSTGWTTASAIHLAPNGAALGFTIDGHAWTIDRSGPSYVVLGVRRDGQPVSAAQLSSKGIPRGGAR